MCGRVCKKGASGVALAFPIGGIHGGQHGADAGYGQWLTNDEIRAFAEGGPQGANVVGGAEHYDGGLGIGWRGANSAREFKPRQCGLAHTQKDNVEALALHTWSDFLGVVEGQNGVAQRGAQRPEKLEVGWLIVDNHDLKWHRLASLTIVGSISLNDVRRIRCRTRQQ